jgi:hypothetical protein
MLGLNISASFNSAVTIYILIPLLLIPQMILSGAIFSFDKLNDAVSSRGKVPLIADLMASRWAFEALAVHQFKNNSYEYFLYDFEAIESRANYIKAYLVPDLEARLEKARLLELDGGEANIAEAGRQLRIVLTEGAKLSTDKIKLPVPTDYTPSSASNDLVYRQLFGFFTQIAEHYTDILSRVGEKKEAALSFMDQMQEGVSLNDLKNRYYNESLGELAKNLKAKKRIDEYRNQLIQQIDPIYRMPEEGAAMLDYRTHFLAPVKPFMGSFFNTFPFNLTVIWFMTIVLYLSLYFELIRKLIAYLGGISFKGVNKLPVRR